MVKEINNGQSSKERITPFKGNRGEITLVGTEVRHSKETGQRGTSVGAIKDAGIMLLRATQEEREKNPSYENTIYETGKMSGFRFNHGKKLYVALTPRMDILD